MAMMGLFQVGSTDIKELKPSRMIRLGPKPCRAQKTREWHCFAMDFVSDADNIGGMSTNM